MSVKIRSKPQLHLREVRRRPQPMMPTHNRGEREAMPQPHKTINNNNSQRPNPRRHHRNHHHHHHLHAHPSHLHETHTARTHSNNVPRHQLQLHHNNPKYRRVNHPLNHHESSMVVSHRNSVDDPHTKKYIIFENKRKKKNERKIKMHAKT
eukprot:PhF_6_TR12904/c1_g1_i2/m.20332